MKSKTHSRRNLDVFNKLAQSCSYNVTEAIVTSLASTICSYGRICPPEIILERNRRTCLAFNNFDRFVDCKTTAGKETLHYTVGISQICYTRDNDYIQLESSILPEQSIKISNVEQFETLNTSKRKFEGFEDVEFEPIIKSLRVTQKLSSDHCSNSILLENLEYIFII